MVFIHQYIQQILYILLKKHVKSSKNKNRKNKRARELGHKSNQYSVQLMHELNGKEKFLERNFIASMLQ